MVVSTRWAVPWKAKLVSVVNAVEGDDALLISQLGQGLLNI